MIRIVLAGDPVAKGRPRFSRKTGHTYTPEKLNNNVPPLVYRLKNGHFYPIVKEAATVCQLGRASGLAQAKAKKEEEETEAVTEVVYLPLLEEVSKVEQMVQICRAQNLEGHKARGAR